MYYFLKMCTDKKIEKRRISCEDLRTFVYKYFGLRA